MDTYITFIGPSAILLKQHVGRYLAQIKSQTLTKLGLVFAHQVVVWHHSVAWILIKTHCICIQEGDRHL